MKGQKEWAGTESLWGTNSLAETTSFVFYDLYPTSQSQVRSRLPIASAIVLISLSTTGILRSLSLTSSVPASLMLLLLLLLS